MTDSITPPVGGHTPDRAMDKDVSPVGAGLSPTAEPVPVSSAVAASIPDADDPIVGHKTWADGSHTPLLKSEADALWAQVEADKARREALMPTLDDCLRMLGDLSQRFRDLGWSEAIYCPKDGTVFDAIEFGSTGIHACHYEGEWPKGSWWVADGGDLWPSRPVLYRKRDAQGTPTRSAETEGLGPKDGGPVGNADAPEQGSKATGVHPHE